MSEGSTRAVLGGENTDCKPKPRPRHDSALPAEGRSFFEAELGWEGRGLHPNRSVCTKAALSLGSSASPAELGDGTACPELQPGLSRKNWGAAVALKYC